MKSKYFFKDHKELIDKEHEELETYQEKTNLTDDTCKHKEIEVVGHELRCRCGAVWSGTALEIQEAYNFFKNQE